MTQFKKLPTDLTKHQLLLLQNQMSKKGFEYQLVSLNNIYSAIVEMFPTLNPVSSEYDEVTKYLHDLNERLAHVETLLASTQDECNCEECTEEPEDPELAKLVKLLENQGFEIIRVK